MIDGVKIKELKLLPDERGYLMEIMRSDDDCFQRFGQCYITAAYPGVVKAWHYHEKQTDNFCAISGMVKVVLFDGRDGSPTHGETMEIVTGDQRPLLITIPAGVLHGYKNIGTSICHLLNIPTELYNYEHPDEQRTAPHDGSVPYDWSRHDG